MMMNEQHPNNNAMMNQQQAQQQAQQQQPALTFSHALRHAMTHPVDPTMVLSDQERHWALELKRAVTQSERLDLKRPLSDLELTQHAMIARGNVIEALVRIEGMERFRREYDIQDSLEQGMYFIRQFMKQQPGYILHFDVNPQTYEAVMVSDSAAFSQRSAFGENTSENAWRICVASIYYYHFALLPTLATMRRGVSATVECDGVGWHNFRVEYVSRLFEEMFSYLPVKFLELRAYNTSLVANLLFSMARPFMSASMRKSVQLGHRIEGSDSDTEGPRRLSEFYLQPNLEMAQHRILHQFQTFLSIRLYHEKNFRLCCA
ncbi:expressed unknown protein [Seminavis robusta]|uniref:CRAL-TRIO domain-containing protein n=1 Tax=Seminavis robusta TaxID=568900 RepID=A0A9N8I0B2_9STRA|nr:expressed unknown protein [Seminavis robusta]|eukprot:Sro2608_g332470.1 n/a (319) ;mRNA; f:8680-9636